MLRKCHPNTKLQDRLGDFVVGTPPVSDAWNRTWCCSSLDKAESGSFNSPVVDPWAAESTWKRSTSYSALLHKVGRRHVCILRQRHGASFMGASCRVPEMCRNAVRIVSHIAMFSKPYLILLLFRAARKEILQKVVRLSFPPFFQWCWHRHITVPSSMLLLEQLKALPVQPTSQTVLFRPRQC